MEADLDRIHQVVNSSWEQLDKIWHRIGHDQASIKKRKQTVHKHVYELLTDMLEEEKGKQTEKEQLLVELVKELVQLTKELSLDPSIVSDAKKRASGKTLTLLEVEDIYLGIAEDLRKRKAIRMEKYHLINHQVVSLCEELAEDLFQIHFDGIPSDAQVTELEKKLLHLQKEKLRRQTLFKQLRKTLSILFEQTERTPRNEVESLVPSDDKPSGLENPSFKTLSLKTLDELEHLESNLRQEISANFTKGEKLWGKIRELWSRLSVEEELSLAFTKVHRNVQFSLADKKEITYKPSVLKGLQSELNRLEEEKRRNMELFITQVRDELANIWTTKIFMQNVNDRFEFENYANLNEFTEEDFCSDVFNEELLDKHEKEAEYWRAFVERNKKIIESVAKRDQMFSQFKELDQKSDDPARLSNRGGALLKEEKERKRLERLIPKLETELKDLASKFSSTKDSGVGMRKFLVFGQEIDDLISSDWDHFYDEKEKRKELRKKDGAGAAHGKTMMTTQLGARASKRPGTPGGMSTPKRARLPPVTPGRTFATPSTGTGSSSTTNSTKKPLANGNKPPTTDNDNFARPATRSRKIITPAASTAGKKIPLGSRIPGFGKGGNPPSSAKEQINPIEVAGDIVSPANSYSEFTDHLLCQSTLNSSAVSTVAKSRKPLFPTDPTVTGTGSTAKQFERNAAPIPASADDDEW